MPKDNKRRKAPHTISQEEFAAAQAEQRAKTARTVQAMESGMREHNQKIAEETVQLQKRNDNLTKALRTQSKRKESVRPSETLEEKHERFMKTADTAIQSRQALIDKLDARYGHRTPQRSASVKRAAPSEQNFAGVEGLMQSLKRNRETKLQWAEQLRQAAERNRQATANSQSPAKAATERKPSPKQSIDREAEVARLRSEWKSAVKNTDRPIARVLQSERSSSAQRASSVARSTSPRVARYIDPDIERDARLYRQNKLQLALRSNPSAQRSPSVRTNAGIQAEPKPVEEEMFPPSFYQGSRSEDIPYLKEIWKRAPEDEREKAVRLYKRTNSLYANDTDRGAMKDVFYKVFVKNQNVHPPLSLLGPLSDSDLVDMTNVFRRAQARIAEQSKELPAFLRDHIGDRLFRDRLTKVWYAVPKQDREVVGSYLSFQPEALEAAERKFINGENVKMPDPYEGSWGNSSKFIAAWNRPRPAPEPAKPKVPEPSFEERVQAEVDKRMAEHFGRQFEQHREDFAQRLKDFDSKNSKLVKQNQRIEREINEQKLLFGKQLADAESIQSQASARADRLERSLKKRKESAKRRQDEISDIRTRMDNTERRRKESTKRRQDEISELRKGIDDRFDSQSEEVSSLRRRMDNTELRRKESAKRRQDEISEIRTRMDNADQQTSKRQRRLEQNLGKQADEVASLRSRMDDHDRQREADRKESERRIEEQKNLTRRRVAVNAALGDLHFVDVNNPGMQIEIGNAMMRGSRKRFARDIRGQRRLIPSGANTSTDVSDIFLSLLNSQKKPK